MLDIATLRVIWWVLLGFLLIGFAITDGFDLGVGTLLPFVARNQKERETVLETIAPFWEGNQVWIILGAGSIFAAWPYVYAVAFSGAYFIVLLLLLTMGISRPVSIKYHSKVPSITWQRTWDWILFMGSCFPAILLGLLVGNILVGLPFNFDSDLRVTYTGSFTDLLQPFPLWCGLISLAMLIMHGGIYLAIKTVNPIRDRSIFSARLAAFCLIILFVLAGFWVAYKLPGYQVVSGINPSGESNPMHKEVVAKIGAWIQNYTLYPIARTFPLMGVLGALGAILTARVGIGYLAFVLSSLSITGVIGTAGVSLFPFILPSSTDLTSSLLVWDASATELSLLIMFIGVLILMPIVLLYTAWVYHVLRGKVIK